MRFLRRRSQVSSRIWKIQRSVALFRHWDLPMWEKLRSERICVRWKKQRIFWKKFRKNCRSWQHPVARPGLWWRKKCSRNRQNAFPWRWRRWFWLRDWSNRKNRTARSSLLVRVQRKNWRQAGRVSAVMWILYWHLRKLPECLMRKVWTGRIFRKANLYSVQVQMDAVLQSAEGLHRLSYMR